MKKYFIPFLFTLIIFTITQEIVAQKKSFTAKEHQTMSDDEFDQKLHEATNQIKPILDTDKFNSGNIDDVRDCVKDIQNILVSTGFDRATASGLLGDLFDMGGKGSSGSGAGVIDYNGGGRDPMAGRIGQDAWNAMCSDIKARAISGNGDVGGRMFKIAAKNCIDEEEKMTGSEISDFRKSTYTNSIPTSSPYLKDGEKVSHNSDSDYSGDTGSTPDNSDDTGSTPDYSGDTGSTSDNSDNTPNASYDNNDDDDSSNSSSDNSSNDDDDDDENSSNDNNSSSSDSEDSSSEDNSSSSDSEDSSSDDDKKKKEEESYWGNDGGGGSEDPVDNEQGGVPMSKEAKERAKKQLGDRNQNSSLGQSGFAGGKGDGRGAESGDQGNGVIQANTGIYGSTDDERIQNSGIKNNSASGPIKNKKQEQFGGTIKVQDHN